MYYLRDGIVAALINDIILVDEGCKHIRKFSTTSDHALLAC